MSSAPSITIRNMTGDWTIDKSKSKNLDAALKLQGIGWLRRKAVLSGTVTLKIVQSTSTSTPPLTGTTTSVNCSGSDLDTELITRITAQQGLRGVFPGVEQTRSLDWTETSQVDAVSGSALLVRSRFVRGIKDGEGRVRPVLKVETAGSKQDRSDVEAYLGSSVSAPVETAEGGGETAREKAFVQDFIRCEELGWTVEQIWAVEKIGSGIFLTCKVVATKGSSAEQACLVYQPEGQK
ncbi:uncharacterized protein BDV17DRAFT_285815 [Aspergillus undulatus]|uniref:uncharacterized protein n=1 Tax=Aspergillus undulatus TaxID=1810928 RepID=UPI003CCD6CB9